MVGTGDYYVVGTGDYYIGDFQVLHLTTLKSSLPGLLSEARANKGTVRT